jgi:2-dehydro-3-deoxygluconokinase/2-dehydro-3-deoxygalactonokinase
MMGWSGLPDVIGLGEIMVQFNAVTPGPLRHVTYFEKHAAGAEANVAVCVRRQGLSSGFITRLGADEFGIYLYNWLRGEGVDVSQIKFDTTAPTGIYFIQRGFPVPGKSSVIYYRKGSAASKLSEEDINPEYFANARTLHLTGITPALSDSALKASKKAVECAKNHGCKLSFDTNIRPPLWRSAEEAAKTLLPFVEQADILFTDLADTIILLGEKEVDKAIESYLSMGVEIVVFKLGAKGAIAASKGERVMARGYQVTVVDTIGAGDALAGTFLACTLKGFSLERSLKFAVAAGTLVVTVRGDQENLPTQRDLETFLKAFEEE